MPYGAKRRTDSIAKLLKIWRRQGDSKPCYRRERASIASTAVQPKLKKFAFLREEL